MGVSDFKEFGVFRLSAEGLWGFAVFLKKVVGGWARGYRGSEISGLGLGVCVLWASGLGALVFLEPTLSVQP